jgi:hypothetical protein
MIDEIGEGPDVSDLVVQTRLRPSLQPVLLTGDPRLAAIWLEAAAPDGPQPPVMRAAARLVAAVRDGDQALCAEPEEGWSALRVERAYWCGRWDEITGETARGSQDDLKARMGRFYLADALARTGRTREAAALFEALERDPAARTMQPFASILGLERFGTLSEAAGERGLALECYESLFRVWNGLDIPLEEMIRVERSLVRLRAVERARDREPAPPGGRHLESRKGTTS